MINDFPTSLGQVQAVSIKEAEQTGSSTFSINWIQYNISIHKGSYKICAFDKEGEEIGMACTSPVGLHYAIDVDNKYRGRWIGSVLLSTKEALDGILKFEWSGMFSRIYFLLKRWYVPIAKINSTISTLEDQDLTENDIHGLMTALWEFLKKKKYHEPNDDFAPFVIRMKYSPVEASEFLKKNLK